MPQYPRSTQGYAEAIYEQHEIQRALATMRDRQTAARRKGDAGLVSAWQERIGFWEGQEKATGDIKADIGKALPDAERKAGEHTAEALDKNSRGRRSKAIVTGSEAIIEKALHRIEPIESERHGLDHSRTDKKGRGRGDEKKGRRDGRKPNGGKTRGVPLAQMDDDAMQRLADAAAPLITLEKGEGDKGSGMEKAPNPSKNADKGPAIT